MSDVIAPALMKSCLSSTSKSSDFVLRQVENKKISKDLKSSGPIQFSVAQWLVPLAMNRVGLRGCHFTAIREEFVT
jgi:hypothetical protein